MKKIVVFLITILFLTASSAFAQSKINETKKSEKSSIGVKSPQSSIGSVKIGNQIWMSQNLNVEKFVDGSIIPEAKTKEEWIKANKNGKPAWCYFDFDSKTANTGVNSGKHYNWYAVKDPRGLAPKGWRIPSEKDWDILINQSGGYQEGGLKMKSISGWDNDGGGENGVIGFAGLPSGTVGVDGYSSSEGESGFWWSTSKGDDNSIYVCHLYSSDSYVYDEHHNMGFGHSVRCIKN